MHDAADETQSLCGIRSIVADVILGRSGIFTNPLFEVRGTGEDVRRMPLFRDLNDNGTLQLENVFGANQEHLAGSSPELVIEERIVVGLPGDLGDVEVKLVLRNITCLLFKAGCGPSYSHCNTCVSKREFAAILDSTAY